MTDYDKLVEEYFTGVIYKITNIVTNKVYIGQTSNYQKRISDHFRFGANKKESDNYLHRSMRKHGIEKFIVSTIVSITTSDYNYLSKVLNKLEISYIKLHDSYNNGYNCTIGGGGGRGFKHSEEFKRNASISRIGKPLSEEHKLALSKSHLGKPHPMSEETKLKIGLKNKGRRPSDECIKKVVERSSKPIIQYSLDYVEIKGFPSIAEAARHLKCASSAVSYACIHRSKCKKHYWKYKEKQYDIK